MIGVVVITMRVQYDRCSCYQLLSQCECNMIGVVVVTMRVQYDRCSCYHNASAI